MQSDFEWGIPKSLKQPVPHFGTFIAQRVTEMSLGCPIKMK